MDQYYQSGLICPVISNKTNDQDSNETESQSMINKIQGNQVSQKEAELPVQKENLPDETPVSVFDRLMFWCREYWYVIAAVLLVLLIVKGK